MPCKHIEWTWSWDVLMIVGLLLLIFVVRELFSWFSYSHEILEALQQLQQQQATKGSAGNTTIAEPPTIPYVHTNTPRRTPWWGRR